MKNYGLQVKEIPIIFRGTVDAAEIPNSTITETEPEYELTPEWMTNPSSPGVFGTQLDISVDNNIFDHESIFVKCDNEDIVEIPRHSFTVLGQELHWFGKDEQFGDPITPEDIYPYPLLIIQQRDTPTSNGTLSATEYETIKIWYTEPEPGPGPDPEIKPGHKVFAADLTGNGQINRFYARFACGENGTLHLKPYVILNGNIRIDLCNFAQGGDQYIAGDNETISFDCFVPVETHAVAYVEAENVGEYPSVIDAAMVVQYEDVIESESIVGYEGINLRRR